MRERRDVPRVNVGEAGLLDAYRVLRADGALSSAVRGNWSRFQRAHVLVPATADNGADTATGTGLSPLRSVDHTAAGIAAQTQAIADHVEEFLRHVPTHLCLFEDFTRDRRDVDLPAVESLVYHGSEVYHLIRPGAARRTIERVVQTVIDAPVCVGVLSSLSLLWSIEPGDEIGPVIFDQIARQAQCIIIGMYDGDRFLAVEP